jgi:hypothetical protein
VVAIARAGGRQFLEASVSYPGTREESWPLIVVLYRLCPDGNILTLPRKIRGSRPIVLHPTSEGYHPESRPLLA